MKINRSNFEANIRVLKKTRLLNKNKKMLEIGSGKGVMVNCLSKKGYDIVGTEINDNYIKFAKNRFGVVLKKMSGENLNFKNNSFDIALSFDVFEHIPNTNKHLKEVRRVLKSNGHYLLQTPNKWTNLPFEIIKNKSFKKHKQYHCSLHNYWELKKIFKKNGFNVKFYKIPVVNDFFKRKIKKQFGTLGLIILKVLNPDYFPYFLKTNFYLVGERV